MRYIWTLILVVIGGIIGAQIYAYSYDYYSGSSYYYRQGSYSHTNCPNGEYFDGVRGTCVSYTNYSPCSNGATNYPYCTVCALGQSMYLGNCMATQICDPLPNHAYWIGGHGNSYPLCEWRCESGYTKNGNTCVTSICTNGAINYPYCTTCPTGKTYINGQCLTQTCPTKPTYSHWTDQNTCQWECNTGYYRSGYTCLSQQTYTSYTYVDTSGDYYPEYDPTPSNTYPQPTSTPTVSVDAECGNALNQCLRGTFLDQSDTSSRYRWRCAGEYLGDSRDCSLPKSVQGENGSCGTQINTCTQGTFVDLSDTHSQYKWRCQDTGNGVSRDCYASKGSSGSDGMCGSAINTCTSGSFSDLSDTSLNFRWRCTGESGFVKDCTSPISVTQGRGSCGVQINTCTAGTLRDISDTTLNYRWRCVGENNGPTEECVYKKSQYRWSTGEWSKCSKTCGKSRSVFCLRDDGAKVADSYCSANKPRSQMSCSSPETCGSQKTGSSGYSCDGSCTPLCRSGYKLSSDKKSCKNQVSSYSGGSTYYGSYYGGGYYGGGYSSCSYGCGTGSYGSYRTYY